MAKVLINGTEYSWSQIKVNILGQQVVGVTKITYKEDEAMEDNFGAGNRPISRSYGKITSEASIEMFMSEIEAIQNAVPTGRLQDIPEFDIVVSYQPKVGRIVNHTLHNVRFKSNGRETDTETMGIKQELDLIVSHISWK
jgi:hypothetical protein